MTTASPSWHRSAYSLAAMRGSGAPHPAASGLRFRRRRRRGRDDAAAQRGRLRRASSLLPRPLNGAAMRDLSRRAVRQAPGAAGDRSGRPGSPACSGRAARCAAARAAAAAGTAYCLSHGSVCTIEELAATGARAALDAGLHLSRPRLHPRIRRARRGERLRRAGARPSTTSSSATASATSATASPSRRASAPRDLAGDGDASCPGCCACARELPTHHLRQLCPSPGEAADIARRSPAAWRRCSIRRCPGATSTWLRGIWKGPLLLKGVLHPGEAPRRVDARRRRGDRLQPWRPPARRRARVARRPAGASSRRSAGASRC